MGTTEIRVDGRPVSAGRAGSSSVPLDRRLARWAAWVPPSLRAAAPVAGLVCLFSTLAGLTGAAASPTGVLAVSPLPGLAVSLTAHPAVAIGLLCAGLLFTLDLLHRLARLDGLPAAADRTAWIAGLSPAAWLLVTNPWLFAPVLLALGAVLAARRTHLVLAGVLAACATPLLPGAVWLALPLGWCLLKQRGAAPHRWGIGAFALALPVATALATTWATATDALTAAQLASATAFGTASPAWPWDTALAWGSSAMSTGLAHPASGAVLALLAAAGLTVLAVRRLHPGIPLLGVALCMAALASATPALVPLFLLLALPLFAALALLLDGRTATERVVLVALALSWTLPLAG